MRTSILIVTGLFLLVLSCSAPKGVVQIKENDTEIPAEDSIEYELETFDLKFENWYLIHNSPATYRSQAYYENWNRQYVSAWNYNAFHSSKSWFFEPVIGYSPAEDYGFELNHELFYYFMYVENVLKIKIMSGGPKSIFL